MNTEKYLTMLFVLTLVVTIPVTLRADGANKATVLTFNQPIEIPGTVLKPGSYVFELPEPEVDDHMVRVLSKDQNQVLATFFAAPTYRLDPDSNTVVTFDERAKGLPEAIKTWFYPGDSMGQEFIYPKAKSVAMANNGNAAARPMPRSVAAAARPATVSPRVVSHNSAPIGQIAAVEKPAARMASSAPHSAAPPKKLPKTASPIPLLTLAGLLSLAAAAGIDKFSRFTK